MAGSNQGEVTSSKENDHRRSNRNSQRASVFSRARMSFVRYVNAQQCVRICVYPEKTTRHFRSDGAHTLVILSFRKPTDLEENEEQLLNNFVELREQTLKARQMLDELAKLGWEDVVA